MSTPPDPAPLQRPHLTRRVVAEALGTGLLVAVVVGSGIAAQRLSPDDVGLQLLENSLTTAFGLAVLILVLGPVSGAHFNPVVSVVDWFLGRRSGTGLRGSHVALYIGAAYWFTSSTSFANPAVTTARMFSDTFAGIAPASVLPYIAAQAVGAAVGLALTLLLFPASPTPAHTSSPRSAADALR